MWEWAARLWNFKLQDCPGQMLQGVPADWGPILDEIGKHYLPYLNANIDAVTADQKRFDAEIGGIRYKRARWSKYRVWCLQQLRDHFKALTPADQDTAQALLEQHGCWEPLWQHPDLPMEAGLCSQLPFHVDAKMIDVYE